MDVCVCDVTGRIHICIGIGRSRTEGRQGRGGVAYGCVRITEAAKDTVLVGTDMCRLQWPRRIGPVMIGEAREAEAAQVGKRGEVKVGG